MGRCLKSCMINCRLLTLVMTASADIPSRTEIRSAERRTAPTAIQLGLQVFSQMSTRTRDSRSKLGFKINCARFADKSLHIRKESELPESLDAAGCCSGKEESKPVSKVRLTNRHDCTRMNRASFENTDGTHICKISPRRPANRAFTATCRWSTYMENTKQCILVQGSAVQYLHRSKESRAKRIV